MRLVYFVQHIILEDHILNEMQIQNFKSLYQSFTTNIC